MTPETDPADRSDRSVDQLLGRLPVGDVSESHVDDATLAQLAAGRLGDDDTHPVYSHLAACADCRTLLANLAAPVTDETQRRTEGLFPAAPRAQAPAGRARMVSFIGAFAAAAALVVGVAAQKGGSGPVVSDHPDFDWGKLYASGNVAGGIAETRGASLPSEPERTRFAFAGKVTWRLAVQGTTQLHPVVSVFCAPHGQPLRAATAEVKVGAEGMVQIAAPAATLAGGQPGKFDLVATVGAQALDLAGKSADEAAQLPSSQGAVFVKVLELQSKESE